MSTPRRSAERARTPTRTLATLFPALALFASIALTGCTPTVPLEAATDATDPVCAAVVVELPTTVADQAQRETDAQGTAAWGTPATVLLHCGVPTPGPTTDRCFGIDGVDWVQDDSDTPRNRYTTYGRTPAVEVVVDENPETGVSASSVLPLLTDAVERIEATGGCSDPIDVFPAETPAP